MIVYFLKIIYGFNGFKTNFHVGKQMKYGYKMFGKHFIFNLKIQKKIKRIQLFLLSRDNTTKLDDYTEMPQDYPGSYDVGD
jgi:hypothetical protein